MKKIFILGIAMALVSCAKNETKVESTNYTEDDYARAERAVDSAMNVVEYESSLGENGENPKVAEAKKLIEESSEWMEKSIRKEISVDEANKHINPLMEEFQKINATLSSAEQKHLENFRIQRAQQSIDLQIKYSE